MKNFKVSSKLLAGFGIAVAFTLTLGLTSMIEMGRLNKGYAEAVNEFAATNAAQAAGFDFDALNKAGETGNALYKHNLSVTAAMILVCVGFSAFLCFYISGLISKPLHAAVNMITEMGKGHLSNRLRLNRKDEIGVMADTMDKFAEDLQIKLIGTLDKISEGELTMELPCVDGEDELGAALRRIVHPLRDLIIDDGGRVLQAAARKDLSLRLTGEYKGDFAKMKNNINAVMENLDDALTHVAAAAGRVSGASVEIAGESQRLAQDSNEQAGALKEVSSSLEEMSLKIRQNAKDIHSVKTLASEARSAGIIGGNAAVVRANKEDVLIENIAAASSEQAHELGLINDFVAHMNQVTHRIAADTDESARTAQELSDRAAELASLVGDFKLSGDAGRWYADRSAAEVWVDLAPEADTYAEAATVEIYEEPAVSTAPAAVSAHKRRQRRRKRMAAYSAERTYKHRRRIRAAARHIANHIVRTDWRKHHPLIRFLRTAHAKELLRHTGSMLGADVVVA